MDSDMIIQIAAIVVLVILSATITKIIIDFVVVERAVAYFTISSI